MAPAGDKPKSGRRPTVSDDWRAELPEDRRRLFDSLLSEWEASYSMLSVALNDAISLRSQGMLVRAREQAAFSADLTDRLAAALLHSLTAFRSRGRMRSTCPGVEPLQPRYFRGETAQQKAAWNHLLHWLLPVRHWQCLLKLRALTKMIRQLALEYRESAEEIAEGTCVEPEAAWRALEILHYDLNTAMRETVVVLKSFLHAVSPQSFEKLRQHLEMAAASGEVRARPGFSRASS